MNSPHKRLRILLVEDSQDDADLIILELIQSGLDNVCDRVETGEDMRAALADGEWDIVISDYNLPCFSAHGALAVLHETGADIPFIVVSGCIGEESAVALMKEGASDFVMKDKLARLAPAIERELQDAALRREHRKMQQALQENEKLMKGITASLGEGLFALDGSGRVLFMNPEAERLLGWKEDELFNQEVQQIIRLQPDDGTPVSSSDWGRVLIALKGDEIYRTEDNVLWRKDGSPIPVSIVASPIMENGKAIASVVTFQDISQRKQAELDLLESRRQLQELSSYLQTVREEERTRIARELHDEFGQMLTGVKLDAMWLAARLSGEQAEVVGKIGSMSKLIDDTLDAMRRVAADLRPVMLDDLGLAAALEWLTEDFAKRTGIVVSMELDVEQELYGSLREDCELDAELSTAAFRIIQECLTNVARHAEAGHVLVWLKCTDDKLMLRVSDDGKGVHTSGRNIQKSFGIIGMRERAHGLGGTLDISSLPEKGTSVEAIIPIKYTKRFDDAGAIQ